MTKSSWPSSDIVSEQDTRVSESRFEPEVGAKGGAFRRLGQALFWMEISTEGGPDSQLRTMRLHRSASNVSVPGKQLLIDSHASLFRPGVPLFSEVRNEFRMLRGEVVGFGTVSCEVIEFPGSGMLVPDEFPVAFADGAIG
jgi:hypothetical protein